MSILRYGRIMVGKYVQKDIKNVCMLISSTIGYINGKYMANKKKEYNHKKKDFPPLTFSIYKVVRRKETRNNFYYLKLSTNKSFFFICKIFSQFKKLNYIMAVVESVGWSATSKNEVIRRN